MSLANVRSRLEPTLHHVIDRARAQPVLATALAGITTATLITAIQDYRAFIALGAGGLPHNVLGWLVNTLLLRPFSLSKANRLYVSDYPPASQASAYVQHELPQRPGPRAETGGIVPHRQLSQVAPASQAAPLNAMLRSFVTAEPGRLEIKRSHYELHNDALYVAAGILGDEQKAVKLPATARMAKGEIAHVHPDRSVHVYLHPADARVVIEKGWGERHRLSRKWPWYTGGGWGRIIGLGDTWIMVYGARDEAEVEVTRRLIGEGVKFMLGEREA